MTRGVYKRTDKHNKNISKALTGRIITGEWLKKIHIKTNMNRNYWTNYFKN